MRETWPRAQYLAVRARMEELLSREGASLAATYHCPHGPETVPPCECRKPAPGLFEQGARAQGLSLADSFFIGDRPRDVLAGAAAGGTGFLIRSPAAADLPRDTPRVTLVSDLAEAVETLLASGPFD